MAQAAREAESKKSNYASNPAPVPQASPPAPVQDSDVAAVLDGIAAARNKALEV